MDKYLLFIFSNFKEKKSQIKLISNSLGPIVASPKLKFNYCDDSMIINFETDLGFEEIKDYIAVTITPLCNQYFLINYSDKMSVNMTKELYSHLFDLDNETSDVDFDSRESIPEHKGIGGNFLDFEQELFMNPPSSGVMLTAIQSEEIVYQNINDTINEILEKIHKTGYESLSEKEKNFLKINSKNQ